MSVAFNKVVLAGNITRDPELRFTASGVPVCNFGIAVNDKRSKNDDAVDFFDVTAWRELGETITNYKKKGDPILIEGKLQYRTWEAQDGSKRSKVDVVAQNVQFLSKGQYGENGNGGGGSAKGAGSGTRAGAAHGRGANNNPVTDLNEEDFDDDIPFAHYQPARPVF